MIEPCYNSSKWTYYKIATGAKMSLTFVYKQWLCPSLPASPQSSHFTFTSRPCVSHWGTCVVWALTRGGYWNLLVFLLKNLLDDYYRCSLENTIWGHCNICHYKVLIKRDGATAQLPTGSPASTTHTHTHTHTHSYHCPQSEPRNIIPPSKGLKPNNISYIVK